MNVECLAVRKILLVVHSENEGEFACLTWLARAYGQPVAIEGGEIA